jgi:sugar lactone lactonase YvrE
MSWQFELVAGPYDGALGGVAWDGQTLLFSAVMEARILRFDPKTRAVTEARRHTGRVNGIGLGPAGDFYGCQEGGRRIIQFNPDGTASVTGTLLEGNYHNHPSDLVVDGQERIWFADPYNPMQAFGPQIFPPLDHASVLRLERDERRAWAIRRMTYDTAAPRAVLLSPDQKTLYVAEGETGSSRRELRAYPICDDDPLGPYIVLHSFGADHRGPHRGLEGLCLDQDGNIVACGGWQRSGPGPLIYVFSPQGAILETHPLPADLPMRCAFGDASLDSLYVTTGGGHLYRATGLSRRGAASQRDATQHHAQRWR